MKKTTADLIRSCHDAAPQDLLRGVMQFNRGEYYPCHETLECLWMAEEKPIRSLYQGIVQIAVALHHWQHGNYRGAVALLSGGRERLAVLPDVCRQVDIAVLRDDVADLLEQIERLGPQHMEQLDQKQFPKIVLHPRATGRQENPPLRSNN